MNLKVLAEELRRLSAEMREPHVALSDAEEQASTLDAAAEVLEWNVTLRNKLEGENENIHYPLER